MKCDSFPLSIICFLRIFPKILSWHAYNNFGPENSRFDMKCRFNNTTSPFSNDDLKKFNLWSNLMNDDSYHSGESLYGSKLALEVIWKHQHPLDCSDKKFLVSGSYPAGFGSVVHVEGAAFGLALEVGRIYLPHPSKDTIRSDIKDNRWQINNEYCKYLNKKNMECYFEPWSNCSYESAFASLENKDFSNIPSVRMSEFNMTSRDALIDKLKYWMETHEDQKVVILKHFGVRLVQRFIPSALFPIVRCSPMRPAFYHYWWRAITATYILRPNNYTLYAYHFFNNDLNKFHPYSNMENKSIEALVASRNPDFERLLIDLSSPTNPGQYIRGSSSSSAFTRFGNNDRCIGTYVRHGDKEIEMELLPLSAYLDVVEYFRNNRMILGNDATSVQHYSSYKERYVKNSSASGHDAFPSAGRKEGKVPPHSELNFDHVFIGSEDPLVIEEAVRWGRRHNVNVFYTDLFNRSQVSARLGFKELHKEAGDQYSFIGKSNSNGTESASPGLKYHQLEYLSMIINLAYLVKCDAWVCTLASNYCRLVDELRATVGGKANRFYADLSRDTCSSPPCIGGQNITSFKWR